MKKNTYKKPIREIRLLIEAFFAYLAYGIFKLIPLDTCTKIGYYIGYYILANIPLKRKIEVTNNIAQTFPNYSSNEVLEVYKKSCGNFGSLLLEIPHMEQISKINRIDFIDTHNVLETIKDNSLLFSAHIGNWELLGYPYYSNKVVGTKYVVYKAPGNKYLNRFFNNIRALNENYKLVSLNKQMLITIYTSFKKEPTSLMMLVDQRIKEGILVDFLYKPAYTSQILPMLAIKQNIPLIPVRSIRNANNTFSIEVSQPLFLNEAEKALPESEQIAILTTKMNSTISSWIKEFPEQWFWLHRRW